MERMQAKQEIKEPESLQGDNLPLNNRIERHEVGVALKQSQLNN